MGDSTPYARLAGVYDELVVDPCYSDWAGFLDGLWADDPQVVSSVLDVCCGTGLLTAELADRGYALVGVDASPEMLARARTLLGPDVPLIEATLPALPVQGAFDAAVSTFDGLNYLTLDELRLTLVAIAAHLRPGGWLVFDIHTDLTLSFFLEHPVVEGEQDGYRFVIRNDMDPVTRACVTDLDLTAPIPEESFTERHRQYLHSDEQVQSALADAGFADVTVIDEYTSTPASASTMRATWIARLPASAGPRP
jgi:SAM-dependent methyltransferase